MASATYDPNSEDTREGAIAAGSGAPGAAGDDALHRPVVESFSYDDGITRLFAAATIFWGGVATLIGLLVSVVLVMPELFSELEAAEHLTFARLRPLHSNAALFAFVGNAVFAAVYYSTQRLCKARMWSKLLSQLHFWSWQVIILAAVATLPLGIAQRRELAELEWPIDIAVAVVWVLFFGVNFFMTLARRRERYLYISLWFYIATILTIGLVYIVNSLAVPLSWGHSLPMWSGVYDAFMQWWYRGNLLAFLLIMPFLGLMYYFLPKAANRPVFSYKLAIVHFWAMVFLYVGAGPHHVHYTAIPEWVSTLAMWFGLMLWMPAWGALINGLLTLRGGVTAADGTPVLRYFAVGLLCYGVYTFEEALMSIKSIAALVQYSDWTIAHIHVGALGWVGMLTFGMLYWMLPRLFQTQLWSPRLAKWHFWTAVAGLLLYLVPIYAAGITESLMWWRINQTGRLAYPEFIDVVRSVVPMWWVRVFGGAVYIAGLLLLVVNYVMTWARRPSRYEVPVLTAARLTKHRPSTVVTAPTDLDDVPMLPLGRDLVIWSKLHWHRQLEGRALRFSLLVAVVVALATILEMVPMFAIRSSVPVIASVQPYTPLELAGREIFVREGCFSCHSQMVRPLVPETQRYGDFSRPGEFVYDRPAQWGTRRIGPDLARIGGRRSDAWHWQHLEDPRQAQISPGSVMPAYPHLLTRKLDFEGITDRVQTAHALGVPYEAELTEAPQMARQQAERVAAEIVAGGGPVQQVLPGGERLMVMDTQAVALIAYLQRLGTDLFRPAPVETESAEPAAAAGHAAAEASGGAADVE